MKIGTRFTGEVCFNYETCSWDVEVWEYYDLETGESVPADIAEARPEERSPTP